MVRLAKGLPPGRIPKHIHVTAVRINVIYHLGVQEAHTFIHASQADGLCILFVTDTGIAQAVCAERVFRQVGGASILPFVSIAALRARLSIVAPAAWVNRVDTVRGSSKPRL